MKPVLLLDVDGVLNACPWDGEFPNTHAEDTWSLVDGIANGMVWPIRYSSVVIDRINAISERVDVRWLTTWKHDAPTLGHKLGLREFPVQNEILPSRYAWWKMNQAAHVLEVEKRSIIWVDDDLTYEWRYVSNEIAPDLPKCFVNPSTDCGLTVKELDTIEQFIETYEQHPSEALSDSLRDS